MIGFPFSSSKEHHELTKKVRDELKKGEWPADIAARLKIRHIAVLALQLHDRPLCAPCAGTGQKGDKVCLDCNGSGSVVKP